MAEPSATSHSLTLDRGLRALAVLARHPEGLTISELAAELDTHRPSVYRLLGPLGEHHLVRRSEDGRLQLAPGLITLAASVTPRLYEVSEPVLQRLSDALGATTALTVRDGEEAVVARVIVPRSHDVHLTYRQGMRHPLAKGAPGHALLAAMPARAGDPEFVTRARRRGYAISHGELLRGATGIGVAVRGPDHEPQAAISAVWIEGIDTGRAADEVLSAAEEITERLTL